MNIVLLYTRVIDVLSPTHDDANYNLDARRFRDTYMRFQPEIEHRMVVVHCGIRRTQQHLFNGVASIFLRYTGLGRDWAAYFLATQVLDCDFLICCNASAHFWRPGWMEPLVAAFKKYGPGVYGPSASYETFPHLRAPCIAFPPELARDYPIKSEKSEDANWIEAGPENFSLWVEKKGYPSLLVTADGLTHQIQNWRKPPNIFRRGDQSNVLVHDRHTVIYDTAHEDLKRVLEKAADAV